MTKKTKFKLIFILVDLLITLIIIYFAASKLIYRKCLAEFEGAMSSAVYSSMTTTTLQSTNFAEYFSVTYNQKGDVSFISTDSFAVNVLSRELANNTLVYFENFCDKGVEVPIGAFSGISMLSGFGKNVNLKIINVTSVKCEFICKFEQAGINQTRQSLYLNVTPDATILSTRGREKIVSSVSVLVYDNFIVGSVPQFYLSPKAIGGSLSN